MNVSTKILDKLLILLPFNNANFSLLFLNKNYPLYSPRHFYFEIKSITNRQTWVKMQEENRTTGQGRIIVSLEVYLIGTIFRNTYILENESNWFSMTNVICNIKGWLGLQLHINYITWIEKWFHTKRVRLGM